MAVGKGTRLGGVECVNAGRQDYNGIASAGREAGGAERVFEACRQEPGHGWPRPEKEHNGRRAKQVGKPGSLQSESCDQKKNANKGKNWVNVGHHSTEHARIGRENRGRVVPEIQTAPVAAAANESYAII
jgi:hypothetical protein